ncbi:MAG: glycerol-3-phosphate dehydrogenase [Geobacteraceae bacterium GWC2_58_44]|nr:MAG: glycerol-3-phosphate dehydrogenase [Geobacteraceae bacterium GWC2_58_44]HBG04305.1 glycerol-3-phosphate dehydrogenase [Geobacter sp.]
MTDRGALLDKLMKGNTFDLLVIGGGATGCGIALDAASRGLQVALAEQGDFACGTSGRSTKLLHGGVRYLEAALLHFDRVQFNLVRDALHERGVLLGIAPHLCRRLTLATPLYSCAEVPYVFAGLKIYDLLAGSAGLGSSRFLGRAEMLARFPMLKGEGLKGGVLYYDGQFNDARMNLALALTAIGEGAAVANHLEVVGFLNRDGRINGARVRERFSGRQWEIRARCVVNACGPSADRLRLMDDPDAAPLLQVSSGIHIVLPRRFAPPDGAGITIPRTEDGRVLFILPWLGGCLVGTTDEPASPCANPAVTEHDVDYLLRHVGRYFDLGLDRCEIRAAWAGLRPLVRDLSAADTAKLARDHVISRSPSGLITIAGGKWTTYRKMALDTVDYAVRVAGLAPARQCRTDRIILWGGEGFRPDAAPALASEYGISPESAWHLHRSYGDQAPRVAELCSGPFHEPLLPGHPYLKGELLYALRREFALQPADFLVRRIPLALLDNRGARAAAPFVLETMARELGWDEGRLAKERQELDLRLSLAL